MSDDVVITGLGAVSSLGRGVRAIRDALWAGRDGLRRVERFDVAPFAPVGLAGVVAGDAGCAAWAIDAAREAWAEARVDESGVVAERIAVIAGTTEGDESDIAGLATTVAAALGARGPQWCVSTACASSANALGLGRDLLRAGDADLVVAGGAEQLIAEMYAGFHALGVLAVEKCAPFGETRGTTLGEGAGFAVLERAGARTPPRVWAFLAGYGLASDAWHETSPDPRGAGIARAMVGCLADAGLTPADVDYVNAHATGTAANDDSEWRGIAAALGARAREIPVSATKGFLGHAQGAAGVLETIATLVCMDEGCVPPSLRVGRGRTHGPPDVVAGSAPRAAQLDVALSNSAAFGGADAVVAVTRRPPPPRSHARRVVHVLGVADVTLPVHAADAATRAGVLTPAALAEHDVRGLDPAAQFLLAAALAALADGGTKIRGALRDRAGIFGAATHLSPETLAEYRRSVDRDGPAKASASAFSRLVLHAPTGTTSRTLALRGPTTTLALQGAGGLAAVAYAARWLAERDDCDLLVVGGVDEADLTKPPREEGAACVVLCAAGTVDAPHGPRISSVATAGPAALEQAIARALAQAGDGPPPRRFDAPGTSSDAPSARAVATLGDAVRALRAGERRALVTATGPGITVAIVVDHG